MNVPAIKNALDSAKVVSIAPDMSLIESGRRPAVDMPSALFGPAWPIVEQVADETSTAPDYAGVAYLSVVASLIGGKRLASPYGTGWKVPAILWMAALGEPSSRKSAPLSMMVAPLWELQKAADEDYKDLLKDYETEATRAKVERAKWNDEVKDQAGTQAETVRIPDAAVAPDEPPRRRYVISDCTPEAAAYVVSANPQGVIAYNDELAGWLEGFDRYNSGGRPFWLEAFEGQPFSVTRKGDGSFDLDWLGISVLGSIQPDRLSDLLSGANDGLVPRILWAWPDKRLPSRPSGKFDAATLKHAYERLDLLAWAQDEHGNRAPIVMPFSDNAADIFEGWDRENCEKGQEGGSLYETFAGKMSGAVVRLALVAELTAWAFGGAQEPHKISEASVLNAIEWVEQYAKPMAERVFGDASVSQRDRNASQLGRYILKADLRRINTRDLRRSPHKSELKQLQAKGLLDDAIDALEDAGWLFFEPVREGPGAGRSQKNYRVNPAAFGAGK